MKFHGCASRLSRFNFGNCAKVSLSPASLAPNKSFKPTPHRGINSALYATLHAVATPPWGGLTPALGGRKAFGGFAFQHADFAGFDGVALRFISCGVASSVRFVWRAQTSHVSRWPASETVIGVLSFPATDTVASVTSGWKFAGARPGFPASISATLPRFHSPRVPSRLTSRSSRPHIVASTACFALRCTLLLPRCGAA